MANLTYFEFLGNCWNNLSRNDKIRFGELWHGYEQVFASSYQRMAENDMNISIDDLQSYHIERWLKYDFLPSKVILRKPIFTSEQDLSLGIATDKKYLLKFQINTTQIVEMNIRGDDINRASIDDIIRNINLACGFQFAFGIYENTIVQLNSGQTGPNAGITFLATSDPTKNAAEFIFGIDTFPYEVPYFPYSYALPYPNVVNIPEMRSRIRDETKDLIYYAKGTDYVLETDLISFKEEPPTVLWAERTYIDEESPWNNYGFLMGIYQKNTPDYLSIIQGLWYAFWTGPRPETIKSALYLLFGLPVAKEDTYVTEVTATTITTTSLDGVERTFDIPIDLVPIVVKDQEVKRFQPLVDGIEVYDKINLPGFISTEIGRVGIQRFLTESATRGPGDTDETKALSLLEEHTFLPQISVNSFVSPSINLGNVKQFLSTIKPIHKTFLSQVIVGLFQDKLDLKDKIGMLVDIDVTPNLDSNQTTFLDSATLDAYETADNEGLNLDSEVVLMQESVGIEVYSFGVLIDSFAA